MSIKERLIKCLENVGVFVDTQEDDICIMDYGIDSIMLISIILEVEDEFDIIIPDEYLNFNTLSSLNGFSKLIGIITENNKTE